MQIRFAGPLLQSIKQIGLKRLRAYSIGGIRLLCIRIEQAEPLEQLDLNQTANIGVSCSYQTRAPHGLWLMCAEYF